MNQDIMNDIKIYLNEFPQFLKRLLKDPFGHIDREVSMDWIKIVLFGFLVEAGTSTLYSIAILNLSGITSSLIFSPIQTLMVIAFISFLVWFILDRIGFSQITFLSIFKVIVIAEMLISIVALPIMIALAYVKSVDFIYITAALLILAKSYLVYRGFSKQFQLSDKRALGIVGAFTVILLAPIISDFFDGYSMRRDVRDKQKLHEIQMEQSIEELEKELGGEE
ncbi:MAG: hypothetical protein V4596_06735 [Bdellovibrionota bacterium]